MNLKNIFDALAHGELSNLYVGKLDADGEIPEDKRAGLLNHVNLGLTQLHTRFHLKEGQIEVPLVPGQFSYTPPAKDLLRIERVYDDQQRELKLNVLQDPESLRTVSHKTLVLPAKPLDPLPGYKHLLDRCDYLTVVYRANHRELTNLDLAYPPEMVEIDLPPTHLQALLLFIASRVHTPIGMIESYHQGDGYYAKFEQACRELEHWGYQLDTNYPLDNFRSNGWV